MDPVLRAALSSWDLRVEVILVLALAGTVFTLGWSRLRKRTLGSGGRNRWQAGAKWRPISYVSGLFILGLALMSPFDVLGSQLFTMHMIQHLLMVMIVPPLLLLPNPLPFLLWGLPANWRLRIGSWLRPGSTFRHILQKTTGPGLVWMYFVVVYWGWHDPNAYVAALQHPLVHDLEHITFFGASFLFWWHVTGAGPRIHRRFAPYVRVAYALSAIPPNMIAGIAIAFATRPIYSHYEAMPRLWGLSVMNDQRLAGVIMWVPGSMMYIMTALVLIAGWLRQEESKPALPESNWATDEALVAPGWEK